ncbi:MAG: UDP-3-O-[3-hydroxymyristoyl] N-acetylglucosamine deacetylase [Deltaproteobacteria bacterium]|nr:UDP-3-O-[3-hydroxymyristoyl] N-acetylglucosamine deacetylase [Deltaproteobacteria bacterium]
MATVLVVDDEAEIRAAVRGVLADEGLRVLEAEDGRQALAVLQHERPELVLLDIWMPEMDGIELLERLRAEPESPEVVMISGHGNIETAVKATKLGAFDFIEKPFSLEGLLRVVTRALDHHAALGQSAPVGDNSLPVNEAAGHGAALGIGARRQRTLRRGVVASGHGLHTGSKTGLILQPMPPGSGIVFATVSSDENVPALLDYVDSTGYATTVHRGGITVKTVEHLLATLHAYGITNLLIKIHNEVPAMDGSAREFCRLIESVGLEEQAGTVEPIVIDRRIAAGDPAGQGEAIWIEPAHTFGVAYTLEYPPPVGRQEHTFVLKDASAFRDEIAPARTFAFLKDMKALASMGLASGGRLDNCILIDEEKVVNTALRFPNEFARHKILDIMGDLYLLGRPLRGFVSARRTGHSDNIALLREIRKVLQL